MRIKKRTFGRDIDMAKLAEKIIDYRRRNNLSMAELAEKAGISIWTVCRLENQRRSTIYGGTRTAFENLGFDI